jgi:hypothetical protein
MRFRLEQQVAGVGIATTGLPHAFAVEGVHGHAVRVTFRSGMSDDEPPEELLTPACEAAIEFAPSPRIQDGFKALARHRPPDGCRLDADLQGIPGDFLDADGRIKPGRIVPFWVLPERLQSFIRQVRQELYAAAARTVGLVRWRIGDQGPHHPLVRPRESWSIDGELWHPLPFPLGSRTSVRTLPGFDEVGDDVQALLDEGRDEPLAYALWREAWELRGPNPRSALLVGMAALEVGVKHYVSAVAPDTRWLLEDFPAPPIQRLLNEYIPGLPTPTGVTPEPVGQEATEVIRDAQSLRNKVAHAGRQSIPPDKLERMLQVARGVLLNLDRYRGFDWPREQ